MAGEIRFVNNMEEISLHLKMYLNLLISYAIIMQFGAYLVPENYLFFKKSLSQTDKSLKNKSLKKYFF